MKILTQRLKLADSFPGISITERLRLRAVTKVALGVRRKILDKSRESNCFKAGFWR